MASIGQPSVHDITDKIVIGGVQQFGSGEAFGDCQSQTPFQSMLLSFDPPRFPSGVEVNLFSYNGDLGQMMETACIDFLRDQRGIDASSMTLSSMPRDDDDMEETDNEQRTH